VKPATVRIRATLPLVAKREQAGRFATGRRHRREDALHRAHRQANPIVLCHAAPADESDPRARLERTAHMSERRRRIVKEHHSKAREQDVEQALGQLGAAGVGHLEYGRRILRR
jgi:hypothetical protein